MPDNFLDQILNYLGGQFAQTAANPQPMGDPNAAPSMIQQQPMSPGPSPIGGNAPMGPSGPAITPPRSPGLVDQLTRIMSNPLVQGTMGGLAGGFGAGRHSSGMSGTQKAGNAILGGLAGFNQGQNEQLRQQLVNTQTQQAQSLEQYRQQQAEAYRLAQQESQLKKDELNKLSPEERKVALFPSLKTSTVQDTATRQRMSLAALSDGAADLMKNGEAKTRPEAMVKFIDAHPMIYEDLPPVSRSLYEKYAAQAGTPGAANPALKNFPLEQRARIIEFMTQAGQDPNKESPSPEVMKAARDSVQQSKVQVGVTIADARGSSYATNRERMQEKYATWATTQKPIDPKTVSSYMTPTGQTPQADQRFKNVGMITPQSLSDAGYRAIAPQFQGNFKAAAQALTQIDRIEKAGEQLFKGVKPGENIGNAFLLNGKRLFGDAAVRGFEAVVLETMPTNAVQSGLTPGRVGDKVIEKIELPIMPNTTDTYDSFKSKIHNLRQRVRNNMSVMYGDGIDPALIAGSEAYSPPGSPTQQQQPQVTISGQAKPSDEEVKAAKKRLGIP